MSEAEVWGAGVRRGCGSAAGAPGRRSGEAPLVLTRRGVLVVRLMRLVVAAGVAATVVLGLSNGALADDGRDAGRVHVVMPGETLWRIAADEVPGRDPEVVVARLREVNDLSSTSLSTGQRIVVPLDLAR